MWILNRAHVEGIFEPEDVELLRKLITETVPDDATDDEREAHAVSVIQLFEQGIRPATSNGADDTRVNGQNL
jgi:hypothetical protein